MQITSTFLFKLRQKILEFGANKNVLGVRFMVQDVDGSHFYSLRACFKHFC